MNRSERSEKRQEFEKLIITGQYSQLEIAKKIGISETTISKWSKDVPVFNLIEIRENILKEIILISKDIKGNYDLIDKYLSLIDRFDSLIEKAPQSPKINLKKRTI